MTASTSLDEDRDRFYGLLAQFDRPERLEEALRCSFEAGYRQIDGYTPYPVAELYPLVTRSRLARMALPLLALVGAIVLGGGAYLFQLWTSAIDYPINVGGRPLNSWPSFMPPAIILGILGAATAAVVWMLILNRLPALYHPVFNDPHFARATEDSFYLCIETADPLYDPVETRRFLEEFRPLRLAEVPW